MFKISPKKGKLSATDRPTPVSVTFKATKEMLLKEHPMIFCHVIEPNVTPDGETVARIPIPLSVHVAYTRSAGLFDFTFEHEIVWCVLYFRAYKVMFWVIQGDCKKETQVLLPIKFLI